MQTFIGPLGYNETAITRPVLKSGIDAGDTVIPVRPEGDDDRGSSTVVELEQVLREIEPSISVEEAQLPHDDFETSVRKASRLFRTAQGETIAVFGGGAREIILPMAVAATACADRLVEAYTVSDVDGRVRSAPFPNVATPVPRQAWPTLEAIARLADESSSVTVTDLASATGAAKSTVSKHATALEKSGAVRSETHGKHKLLELTLSGELRLRAREQTM